jgi:hypothetical protein
VAVIDDGVENHEDIDGRVLPGFTPRNAGSQGAPAPNAPPANLLTLGHGQACAGIIAATHNSLGIIGVAPGSLVVPVNIFWDWFVFNQQVRFNETAQDLAAAINWAWDPNGGNADVISNSWGFSNTAGPGGIDSDAITQSITNARTQGRFRNGQARGSVVVFASGNSHQSFSGVTFPANVNGVITVGAINRNGAIWNYSSRGAEMDLVAPSGNVNLTGDIVTTDRTGANGYDNGNYTGLFGGTSAACPQISGVAALMLSANPDLSETQVRTILQQTATDMGSGGFDNTFGFGRVDAYAAVTGVLDNTGISIGVPQIICENEAVGFALNGTLPTGATVNWQLWIPGIPEFTSGTGTVVNTTTTNSSGTALILFNVSSGGCNRIQLLHQFWVGYAPYYPAGYTEECHNRPIQFTAMSSAPDVPADLYRWYLDGNLFEESTNAVVWIPAPEGNHQVGLQVYNSCGWSPLTTSDFVIFRCGWRYSVYPNSTDDLLTISQTVDNEDQKVKAEGKFTAQIFNKSGENVKTEACDNGSVEIDTKKWPEGMYLLKITDENGTSTQRVIVNHSK